MANDTFYAAVDIGTTKTSVIIARVGGANPVKIAGVGYTASKGYSQGRVGNSQETQTALKTALDDAMRYFGNPPDVSTYATLSSDRIKCYNTEAEMGSGRSRRSVTHKEVVKLVESSYPQATEGTQVLHAIPIDFDVDGLKGVRNPVGLQAEKVKVESHIILCDSECVKDIVNVMNGCKLPLRSLVSQSIASGEAVLTESERELGVCLVDMGGGTTDLTIFRGGNPWYSAVIPLGGMHMTRDLAMGLDLPFDVAEEVKLDWGHAMPQSLDPQEEATIPSMDAEEPEWNISQRALCQPLRDRLEEILQLVLLRVRQAGMRQLPPGGIVATGGCAEMPGFEEMVQSIVGGPVRVAWPMGVPGLPSNLARPAFAASVGTLIWGIKHQGRDRLYTNGNDTSWMEKLPFGRGDRESYDREVALPLASRRGQ